MTAASIEAVALWLLGGLLFPLWLASGLGDYLCHRATRIEATSGIRESIFHLVLASATGSGVLMLLFLEINLALVLILTALFAVHEVVTQLDLRWSTARREITAIEQQIHAFLEAVPFAALVVLWLLVLSTTDTSLSLTLRAEPISPRFTISILAAMALFGALPYWEEFARCLRGSTRTAPATARQKGLGV